MKSEFKPPSHTILARSDPSYRSYIEKISRFPQLSPEETAKCFKQVAKGSTEAKEKLVKANLRFIPFIIDHRIKFLEIPIQDAICEGNIALMKAIDGFDTNRNTAFGTYLATAIINTIRRAADHGSPYFISSVPFSSKKRMGNYSSNTVYISQLQEENPEIDFVDEKSIPITDKVYWSERDKIIQQALNKLKEREKIVIIRMFGLDGKRRETLRSLGKKIGVTPERIRQIKGGALAKLRNSQLMKVLEYENL